jgi:alkylhydroperoxidase/carboxymuconolactone decarboxylase family protein YurZ
MKLDEKVGTLVAIGSAAAVNCHDCLRHLADRAAAANVGEPEVAAAVQIGLRVSRSASDKTETFAAGAFGADQPGAAEPLRHTGDRTPSPAAAVAEPHCCAH